MLRITSSASRNLIYFIFAKLIPTFVAFAEPLFFWLTIVQFLSFLVSFFKIFRESSVEPSSIKIYSLSKSGYDEPVEKLIYPSLDFKVDNWETKSQLHITKGFQPPLRDFIPSAIFDIFYSIKKRNVSINVKAGNFKNCVYIEGKGKSEFIADTRSGPINVDIFIKEWICPGVGIVKQQRQEQTKASAFGNMSLEKVLINFKE